MKTTPILWISALLATFACAEFTTWTNSEGKSAQLELISVTEEGSEKSGQFRLRNGKTTTIKASGLSEADARRLAEWQPPTEEKAAAEASPEAPGSVFDSVLEKNLVTLQGRSLRRHELASKPKEFYVFYYTASWCGPCQAYTPSLVDFYESAKGSNSKFELVLISSDQDEDAMEEYAKDKKMPWPQLKLSKVEDFKKKFNHEVNGIPSVIVCDLEGKVVSRTTDLAQLGNLLK